MLPQVCLFRVRHPCLLINSRGHCEDFANGHFLNRFSNKPAMLDKQILKIFKLFWRNNNLLFVLNSSNYIHFLLCVFKRNWWSFFFAKFLFAVLADFFAASFYLFSFSALLFPCLSFVLDLRSISGGRFPLVFCFLVARSAASFTPRRSTYVFFRHIFNILPFGRVQNTRNTQKIRESVIQKIGQELI